MNHFLSLSLSSLLLVPLGSICDPERTVPLSVLMSLNPFPRPPQRYFHASHFVDDTVEHGCVDGKVQPERFLCTDSYEPLRTNILKNEGPSSASRHYASGTQSASSSVRPLEKRGAGDDKVPQRSRQFPEAERISPDEMPRTKTQRIVKRKRTICVRRKYPNDAPQTVSAESPEVTANLAKPSAPAQALHPPPSQPAVQLPFLEAMPIKSVESPVQREAHCSLMGGVGNKGENRRVAVLSNPVIPSDLQMLPNPAKEKINLAPTIDERVAAVPHPPQIQQRILSTTSGYDGVDHAKGAITATESDGTDMPVPATVIHSSPSPPEEVVIGGRASSGTAILHASARRPSPLECKGYLTAIRRHPPVIKERCRACGRLQQSSTAAHPLELPAGPRHNIREDSLTPPATPLQKYSDILPNVCVPVSSMPLVDPNYATWSTGVSNTRRTSSPVHPHILKVGNCPQCGLLVDQPAVTARGSDIRHFHNSVKPAARPSRHGFPPEFFVLPPVVPRTLHPRYPEQ